MTTISTFENLLAITEPTMRPIAHRLREIIFEIDANNVEVVRLGERSATYGVGPKKMSEGYVYILSHTKWVNLGFYKGAVLADPSELLVGTGKSMRHIRISLLEDANDSSIRLLIAEAIAERKSALGIS